jgi:hypothetical protein
MLSDILSDEFASVLLLLSLLQPKVLKSFLL